MQFGIQEVVAHKTIVTQLASSLDTPHLPTRKLLLDMLALFLYWDDFKTYYVVLGALQALSTANGGGKTPFDFWFKSMESSLSGRGKMGTLVGASDEVKRGAGGDVTLNDYAVCKIFNQSILSCSFVTAFSRLQTLF
jgi:cytokinesis protein